MKLAIMTALILASACSKPGCPWDWVPGTTVEACSASSLTRSSAASQQDLSTAFRAHGFTLGRDQTWMPDDKRLIAVARDGKTFMIDYAGGSVTLQPDTVKRSLIMETKP